jgi:hypothetical protein
MHGDEGDESSHDMTSADEASEDEWEHVGSYNAAGELVGGGHPGRTLAMEEPSLCTSACCDMMAQNVNLRCPDGHDVFECVDNLVYHSDASSAYGLLIHDGGSSFVRIAYCPWCGTNLGSSE